MNWVEALALSAIEGCAYVRLTNGMCSLVDEEDLEWLSTYRFYPKPGHDTFYAESYRKHCGVKSLHRLLMGAKRGEEIDHKNRNGLDNRKRNLRRCTRAQNRHNAKKRNAEIARSRFKGVKWERKSPTSKIRWRANAMKDGKGFCLGSFRTEREAALAYNKFAIEHFGEFARLNEV